MSKPPKPPIDSKEQALRLLSRREHSARELKRKLAQRGQARDQVDDTVDALRDANLQSDDRFADALIRRRSHDGFGPLRIRAELRSHGIDDRAINELMTAAGIDWLERLQMIIQRKYGQLASDRATRLKQAGYLLQRGFPGELIQRAARLPSDD